MQSKFTSICLLAIFQYERILSYVKLIRPDELINTRLQRHSEKEFIIMVIFNE
jgi:hypothetical protein